MANMETAANETRQKLKNAQEEKEVNEMKETPILQEEAETKQTAPSEAASEPAESEDVRALREENDALRGELERLGALIREMSEKNHESASEEAGAATLNWDELVFEDPDTVKARMEEYEEAVKAAAREEAQEEMEARMAHVLSEIRAREEAMAYQEMVRSMKESSAMPGFGELFPRVDAFVKQNGALYGGVSPEEAYVNAYLAQKGYDAIHASGEPDEDAMILYYEKNPSFQKRIEEARLARAEEEPSAPPFVPSEGAGGAALSLPQKPKTFEDARRMAEGKKFRK